MPIKLNSGRRIATWPNHGTLWWTYKKQWKMAIYSGCSHEKWQFYAIFNCYVSSPNGNPNQKCDILEAVAPYSLSLVLFLCGGLRSRIERYPVEIGSMYCTSFTDLRRSPASFLPLLVPFSWTIWIRFFITAGSVAASSCISSPGVFPAWNQQPFGGGEWKVVGYPLVMSK